MSVEIIPELSVAQHQFIWTTAESILSSFVVPSFFLTYETPCLISIVSIVQ